MIEIIKFNNVVPNICLIDRNHVNLTIIVVRQWYVWQYVGLMRDRLEMISFIF